MTSCWAYRRVVLADNCLKVTVSTLRNTYNHTWRGGVVCHSRVLELREKRRGVVVKMGRWTWILGILMALIVASIDAGDMMRKSIVFNKKTPDVFYCPQRKPTGFDKLLVQARPLSKLCEHEGKALPADYKSDCYNDVDESEYACKEKYRIMKRIQKEERAEGKKSRKDSISMKY